MNQGKFWSVFSGLFIILLLTWSAMAPQAAAQQSPSFISLSLSAATVDETVGAGNLTGTVTRSGSDVSQSQTFTLTSSDSQRAAVPSTVTILAGNTSATFPINIIDNTVIDTNNSVQIAVTNNGTTLSFVNLNLIDDEAQLTITISPSLILETSGDNAATATLTRTARAAAQGSLTVEVSANDPSVKVPAQVTIPEGQTSVTFPVGVVDDDQLNGIRNVSISVRPAGTLGSLATATVQLDDDESRLTLTLLPAALSEGKFANSSTLTISRTEVAAESGPANIVLESTDTSEATVPPFVFMPEGIRTANLPVSSVDDGLVDGTQSVTIRASVELLPAGRGSVDTTVADNDAPQLELTLNSTAVAESAGDTVVLATLSRNTEVNRALTVELRSSDINEATIALRVVIPIGAVSVNVPIRVINDTVKDGAQVVNITASQSTFRSATASFTVYDDEGPTLRVVLAQRQTQEDRITVEGVVYRSGPLGSPLTVTLKSSNPSAVVLGGGISTVAFGPNEDSARFTLISVDNELPEDIQNSTITATAAGYNPGAATLRVDDDDDPAVLSLSVVSLVAYPAPNTAPYPTYTLPPDAAGAAVFPERAGTLAAIATLTRNSATTSELVVNVTPGNNGDVRTPRIVSVPVGVRSVTFYISAVDDLVCDTRFNNKFRTITASMAGFESASARVLIGQDDLCDGRELYAVVTSLNVRYPFDYSEPPPAPQFVEANRSNVAKVWVIRRDDEVDYDLVVDLVSSDPSRAAVEPVVAGQPTRVIVPPDPSSDPGVIERRLRIFDNTAPEGCQPIIITPVAVGYIDRRVPVSQRRLIPVNQVGKGYSYIIFPGGLQLKDNDTAISGITFRPGVLNESGSSAVATGVVTRVGPFDSAVAVTIRSLNPGEIRVGPPTNPTATLTVTIPAGESSASFAISAVDESVVDGNKTVLIEAIEAGDCFTVGRRVSVIVRDDDLPSISLNVNPLVMTEGQNGEGTLVLNTTPEFPLTVALFSADTSEVTLPRTVVVPAGQRQVKFPITVLDDKIVDGTQRFRLTASAPGFRPGIRDVAVLDANKPTFTLQLASPSVSESAGARATVATLTRNTPTNTTMLVALSSSNAALVKIPTSVVIPAGAKSVSFAVDAIDNTKVEAARTVILTASKNGFISGSAQVIVTDND